MCGFDRCRGQILGDAPHFAARMAVIFGESQNAGQAPKEPALRGKEDNAPASQNPALGAAGFCHFGLALAS